MLFVCEFVYLVVSVQSALAACERCGAWAAALQLLDRCASGGFDLDRSMWWSAARALLRGRAPLPKLLSLLDRVHASLSRLSGHADYAQQEAATVTFHLEKQNTCMM